MGTLVNIMDDKTGSTIVSIILGLGLAAIFRKVCDDKKCVVIRSPNTDDLEKYYYQVQGDCYKYVPENVSCKKSSP